MRDESVVAMLRIVVNTDVESQSHQVIINHRMMTSYFKRDLGTGLALMVCREHAALLPEHRVSGVG